MSNISDYRTLVAAMTVSFTKQNGGAISLTAKDSTSLKNAYSNPDTPVRLLLPYGGGENMSAEVNGPDAEFGPNFTIRWTFSDVMLWRHVQYGDGFGDSAYDLWEYVAAYAIAAEALEQGAGITDRMTKDSVRIRAYELIDFPSNSGNFFIGAIATWTITEDDPPK